MVIGSVVALRSPLDPGVSSVQYVGTSGYTFAAIKLVAGSAEGGLLYGIRWHQGGTAIPGDLEVKTVVNGFPYDTTASADGRYYTSIFNPPIRFESGRSIDVSIGGVLLRGGGHTINFDIYERADIYITGAEYRFGILPAYGATIPLIDSAAVSSLDGPYYDGAAVTISEGDMLVSVSQLAPNQNIFIDVPNQQGGAFKTIIRGEAMIARRLGFNVTLGSEGATADVDDIVFTLVDENGAIVAGPIDGTATDSSETSGAGDGSVVFTDRVVFPIGEHHYFVKMKTNTDIVENVTIQLSTTPCTDFIWVSGVATGKNIVVGPCSKVTLSRMTAKSPSPVSRARFTSFKTDGGRIDMRAFVQGGHQYYLEWTEDFKIWNRDDRPPLSPTQDTEWGFDLVEPSGRLPSDRRFFRIVSD